MSADFPRLYICMLVAMETEINTYKLIDSITTSASVTDDP